MKKTVSAILLTGVFAAMPAMVAAASQEEAKTEPSKEIVLNKFKDNWMISLEGGVDFSLGRFDSHADLVSVLILCLVLMSRNGFLLLSGCVWALIIME